MTLWLVLGAIALLCVGTVLYSLLRGAKTMPARSQARAGGRGIVRRLFARAPEGLPATAAAADSGGAARRWTVLGLAAAIPLLGLGLYLVVGMPTPPGTPGMPSGAPDAPVAAPAQAAPSGDMPDIGVALPALEARLKAKPDDLEGWVLLARSYGTLGRYAEAIDAYAHALPLANGRPDVVAGYAESKVLQGGGVVTPETRKLFEEVLAKDPHNVAAGYYLGLAKVQEGDAEAGVRDWLAIQAEAPPDAPWLPGLHGTIQQVAQEHSLDLAKLTPPGAKIVPPMTAPFGTGEESGTSAGAAPGAASGPSDADVAAAQSMTDEERNQMIRGMVERLATRLRQQPDDVEGWRRLARAYTVLGEHDKAADAEARAAQLAP